jgi:DNA-binding MarR family transcriptional regulator
MQEIDVELFAFVERYATNLARWDLLLYFGQNPNTRDDASDIAGRIGRRPVSVRNELDDLAYLGVVQADRTNHVTHYELSGDLPTRRAAMRMARNISATR